MEDPNEPIKTSQRDFTIPLLISGFLAAVICIVIGAVLFISRNFIRNDIVPRLGLVDPTPTAIPTAIPKTCPPINMRWETSMVEGFNNNNLKWPVGKETDEYGNSDIRIEDSQLLVDLSTTRGVFFHPTPASRYSLTDFYLTVDAQQLQGIPFDGFGLFLRADGAVIHYFHINEYGHIILQQFSSDKQWSEPLYSQYSIPIRNTEMNKLTIIDSETQTVFCVNDTIAFDLDSIGYVFGNFGVALSLSGEEQNASFAFDNFKLFAPLP
jgi:hypothetical protein